MSSHNPKKRAARAGRKAIRGAAPVLGVPAGGQILGVVYVQGDHVSVSSLIGEAKMQDLIRNLAAAIPPAKTTKTPVAAPVAPVADGTVAA